GNELLEPLDIHPPAGWKLEQDRTEPPFQLFDHSHELLDGLFRVPEFLVVGDEAAGFDGEAEVRRRFAAPAFQRGRRGQGVEAVVDLDGIEALYIPAQHLRSWQIGRIERAFPVLIVPARSADVNSSLHWASCRCACRE